MDKAAKRRTVIGIVVLLFANSAAGGAEWCSSALANIASTFPDVPYSVITLVNNIPNLCAVVFTLVAGLLVNRKVSLRTMIIIGIGLHAAGGVMPALLGEHSIMDNVPRPFRVRHRLRPHAGHRHLDELQAGRE